MKLIKSNLASISSKGSLKVKMSNQNHIILKQNDFDGKHRKHQMIEAECGVNIEFDENIVC